MALAAGDGQQHQHATTLPCGDDEIIKYVFIQVWRCLFKNNFWSSNCYLELKKKKKITDHFISLSHIHK